MFVRVPRTIEIHEYIGTDGQRRSVADLIDTPGLFYERARVEANLTLYPDLLEQICLRRLQKQREMPMLVVSTWRLGLDRDRPEKEMSLRCTQRGLLRAPAPQAGGR